MNISNAAKLSGLSAKTIRYYEELGLVAPARRADNGYRDYSNEDVEQLCFLARARALGFSLEECQQLQALMLKDSSEGGAKSLVMARVTAVEAELDRLQTLRRGLLDLAEHCACGREESGDCGILSQLGGQSHGG